MRKSTKKIIISLVIIFIFGMSTIAFVFSGLRGTTDSASGAEPLPGAVIDTAIKPDTETVYIQNQYTFLKFYYQEKDDLYIYAGELPTTMSLPGGEVQLIVNRIQTNVTRAEIVNLNGQYEIESPTKQKLFDGLCQNLLFTPTDCLIANMTTN